MLTEGDRFSRPAWEHRCPRAARLVVNPTKSSPKEPSCDVHSGSIGSNVLERQDPRSVDRRTLSISKSSMLPTTSQC